jgi:putative ABC transport system ATP-binding protein
MLLDIEGLTYSRGADDQRFTVELPSFQLEAGDLVAITGRSGSGKSTLLELLGLLTAPRHTQRFHWRGKGHDQDLRDLWKRRKHGTLSSIRGTSMGFILQTSGLLPFLSVADNIALVRRALGQPKHDPALDRMIDRLDVGPFLHKKPRQLAVGQQQRASIVRALAHGPALVLADEPTSALDPDLGDAVMALLLEQARDYGISVVLATHEIDRVEALGIGRLAGSNLHPETGFAWRFGG